MKPAAKPYEMHWFPFYVKDFKSSASVERMTDAEVGRYLRLLLRAWNDGTKEPSLEADDFEGATARVKRMFAERDGRFYNERQVAVWKEQRAKHRMAVERAKKGGRASGRRRANSKFTPSSLEAPLEANKETNQSALLSRESIDSLPSSTAGALAADAPRPAGPRVFTGPEAMRDVLSRVLPPQRGEVQ